MFRILCKSIHSSGRTTSEPQLLFPLLRFQQCSSSPSNANKPETQESFTVHYLINEFGFSQEKAVSASKNMHFETRDKPDAVVSFFKNQGFNDTQIRHMVTLRTRILIRNPVKSFIPKIEFFRSKGVSSADLVKIVAFDPTLLTTSLEICILPSFKFYRSFIGSDQGVISMLKRDSTLLNKSEYPVKQNIEILRRAGVPNSKQIFLFTHSPSVFVLDSDKLKEFIKQVKKLGMNPQSSTFCIALSILTSTPRSEWNERLEAYKRWGCSEDEVLTSFKMVPEIMIISKEKINELLSFCSNEMAWEPSKVVKTEYFILTLSLNKIVLPRWSVYKELVSKRLVNGKGELRPMFKMKEDMFLEKYVNRYKDKAPLLSKLYLEKLEASK